MEMSDFLFRNTNVNTSNISSLEILMNAIVSLTGITTDTSVTIPCWKYYAYSCFIEPFHIHENPAAGFSHNFKQCHDTLYYCISQAKG